jgi:cyclic pyranopterin phosphate synthase
MKNLTHFDENGRAIMVDVSEKPVTHRVATSVGEIRMLPNTLKTIKKGTTKKGDVIGVARIAAIQGAKRVADLIPLCHPLPVTSVTIDFEFDEKRSTISIRSTVATIGRTGVEMEAMVSVGIGLLTIYDMCKAIDRAMVIGEIRLQNKSGGRSGNFVFPGKKTKPQK